MPNQDGHRSRRTWQNCIFVQQPPLQIPQVVVSARNRPHFGVSPRMSAHLIAAAAATPSRPALDLGLKLHRRIVGKKSGSAAFGTTRCLPTWRPVDTDCRMLVGFQCILTLVQRVVEATRTGRKKQLVESNKPQNTDFRPAPGVPRGADKWFDQLTNAVFRQSSRQPAPHRSNTSLSALPNLGYVWKSCPMRPCWYFGIESL